MKDFALPWFRRTVFDGPLLLFLISAAWGAWVAYDQAAGWSKFALVVGGVALFYVITQAPEDINVKGGRHRLPFHLLLLLLPSAIAIYFLITNDWLRDMGNPAWLDLPRRWLGGWQPGSWNHQLHPNQAAGLIAAFVPLQIAALGARRSSSVPTWIAVPLLCLSAIGLLMSAARGAWLALAVAMTVWALCLVRARLASNERTRRATVRGSLWIVAPLVLAPVIFLALLTAPATAWPQGMDTGRLALWRNSLDLASDYPLTGLGLASFEMAYSSYVLLLHVPFQSHAHNLLLNVWLEQGVLGLVAVAWLLAAAARPRQAESYWQQPALVSLAVILMHGLVDDAFYGYDGSGILLLFVPFALLVRPIVHRSSSTPPSVGAPTRSSLRLVHFLPALALFALAALLFLTGWQAAVQANLGALAQTRAELSIYRYPEWPVQDALRRSSEIDLAPALTRYRAALALDAGNVTANRRLGQIELSLGEYEAARKHLEAAYAAAPNQRSTRQLLGEVYAVTGEVERAALLWGTLDMRQPQLDIRRWWYEYIGQPQWAARIAEGAN